MTSQDYKDYKRGYGKGYTTGCKRSDAALARERAVSERAAKRAERVEKAQGLGHCEDCQHWVRGGRNYANASQCAWGMCEAPRGAGTPWGTYAIADSSSHDRVGIQTSPRFGCVLFLQKATP